MKSRRARAAQAAALIMAIVSGATCGDASPTGASRRAMLAVVPSFAVSPDAPAIPIVAVRVLVRRLPALDSVLARVTPVPDDTADIRLDLNVPIRSLADRFRVSIAAIDAAGDTVYRATADSVRAVTGGNATPVQAPLVYSGADTIVASVVLAPRDTSLYVGDSTDMRAEARLAGGEPRPGALLRFRSRDSLVVSVRSDGRLRALAATAGTWVVVTTANGRTDSTRVAAVARQFPTLARVDAGADRALTALDDTVRLAPVGRDAANAVVPNVTFAFQSLAPAVASVDGTGLVTAHAVGSADVVASVEGRADTVRVTVTQQPASIDVAPEGDTLSALGDSTTLTAVVRDHNGHVIPGLGVTWSSQAPAVASVTAGGVVHAIANGTATIRAAAAPAAQDVAVVVAQAVESIDLSRDTLRLAAVGDTGSIVGTPRDRNGNVATNHPPAYASSDTLVARVSAAGLVTLTGPGVATITVLADGRVATAVVIKTPAHVPIGVGFAYIRVTPATRTMAVGDTLTFVADFVDADGNATRITPQWATSHPGHLSISSAGLATASAVATVTLNATHQGLAGQATVSVVPAPKLSAFGFSPRLLNGVGTSTLRFSVSMTAEDAGTGITSASATFTAPDGATQSCTATVPVWGTGARGAWDCVVTIPAGSASGTWRATSVTLNGSVTRTFTEAQLAAFGGTTLQVNP